MDDAIAGTRKRGRPPTGAVSIHLRIEPDQLAALDGWIKATDGKMSRPEAIRRLLETISAVPADDALPRDISEQVQLVEQGRRSAAHYARERGREDDARRIEAGRADTSPLVQTMMWFQLP